MSADRAAEGRRPPRPVRSLGRTSRGEREQVREHLVRGRTAYASPREPGRPHRLRRPAQLHVVDPRDEYPSGGPRSPAAHAAEGRPCIDAIPIPAATNEVGHFQAAFASLCETYAGLFDLVTYDAGGFSRAIADAAIAAGKDYLFALEDEHRAMCRLADELLAVEDVADRTEDVLDNETTVVRSLRLLRADPSWSYGDGKRRRSRSGRTRRRSSRSST